jgi:transposase
VKPYVRRNKSDQVDAAAIYEAMSRPGQRFVPVRSIDNQAELIRDRARELLAGQRTAALNALRGHLAEIGLIAPQGAHHAYGLKRMAVDGFNENGEIVVPDCVRGALRSLVGQIDALDEAIGAIDRELAASVKADETAKRLMTIPGVGSVTASAIRATIQDASAFASGREFAAFLGLTPRQNSTGGWWAPGSRMAGPERLFSLNNHGRLAAAASEHSALVATVRLLVPPETEDKARMSAAPRIQWA